MSSLTIPAAAPFRTAAAEPAPAPRRRDAPAPASMPAAVPLLPAANDPLRPGLHVARSGVRLRGVRPSGDTAKIGGPLHVEGRTIRDAQGRQVLLRGVNVGSKRPPFLPPHTDRDIEKLVETTGVNFVRLYIAWRAVEPEPGKYDAKYIDEVAKTVDRFNQHGLYVLLDMHQDVWGGEMAAHGAPDWASLGRNEEALSLPDGMPWAVAYAEPRTWKSFEAFWANEEIPETGLPIQTHYARAWGAVAERMRGNDGVLGYDLMNEPFLGNELPDALTALAESGWGKAAKAGLSALGAWVLRRSPKEAFVRSLERQMRDPKQLAEVLDGLRPVLGQFEERLSAFYKNVGQQIRDIDPDRPLFIEPVAIAGIGAPSQLPHPGLDNLVYAPHLYDAFVDSGAKYDGKRGRIRQALLRHQKAAERLNLPLVVGEYGHITEAVQNDPRYPRDVARIIDQEELSAAYWEHTPGKLDDPAARALLARPQPRRIAGRLVSYRHWRADNRIKVNYYPDTDIEAPTEISVPKSVYPNGVEVEVSAGEGVRWSYDRDRGVVLVHHGEPGLIAVKIRPR